MSSCANANLELLLEPKCNLHLKSGGGMALVAMTEETAFGCVGKAMFVRRNQFLSGRLAAPDRIHTEVSYG